MCEGVMPEILYATKFDKNSDLGKEIMNRSDNIKTEDRFPVSDQGYTTGKLFDGIQCQILLDTLASKSFMS